MSTYEAAYKSLLQGVSQQLPEERLPGQLTSQHNMVSDPVTNLRRRPGTAYKQSWAWTDADDEHVFGWFTDIAGQRVHLLLNTNTGNIRILNEAFVEQASLAGGAYLTNADPTRIRATAVGNEFFMCNVDEVPTVVTTPADSNPALAGFFYISAGAFSKNYNVSAVYPGTTTTASYTTPSGAAPGDAALATPEYIAEQLRAGLAADTLLTVTRDGPYVFVSKATAVSITTTVGTQYMTASNGGFVTTTGNLPARLPSVGDGYICRVGSGDSPLYYKYQHSTLEWVEAGAYGSPKSITNVPISVQWSGSVWSLDTTAFTGRFAGDDDTNGVHDFMTYGITGISTFQGRLVLMAGPLVSMSASGKPRQFFRTTVTSVISSDPIEIGSGMNSSAAYEWALPFNKDLLLFSRSYQALVPSGNIAVTPSTATVMPTSAHEVDTTSSPIALGRTLMYCNPRSEDFFGVLEMVPSNSTDSQYVSQDSTPHLPKYMGGRCRFAVSSGVASIALFAPSGDPYSLIVHEYHWDGDNKVQQAWHQWTFEYPVATAYFASDVIVIGFVKNETMVLSSVDPRAGSLNASSQRRPFLDLNVTATYTAHNMPIPAWMLTFDPDIADKLEATVLTGAAAGERIGTTVSGGGTTLTTVLSYVNGTAGLGIPYVSSCIPTPPVVTDYKDQIIHTGKATLLRYLVGTKNSSEFQVNVSDDRSEGEDVGAPTLSWSSPELELGRGLFSDRAMTIVPCRTDLRSTAMELSTGGTGELNITALEYVAKYHAKIKRK